MDRERGGRGGGVVQREAELDGSGREAEVGGCSGGSRVRWSVKGEAEVGGPFIGKHS
jgi:hypothetical protein